MDTPNIRAIRPDKSRNLVITWKGGAESVVDVAKHLTEYAIFAPLRDDDALFRSVKVGDWGWCAHWSDDMEISSDTLWRLALDQGSAWLRTWRTTHCLTQAEAAQALGVSPRMWRYYEGGSHLLPKTVRLASVGVDSEVEVPNFFRQRARNSSMPYQERLLLYADILGSKTALMNGSASMFSTAVDGIHRYAEDHNERSREELMALDGKIVQTDGGPERVEVFRGALEVQFGAFSDHFVFSLPDAFAGRILNAASKLILDLLHIGFLVRGAVVLGKLYHRDNIIFGPALLEAVEMEEREAFYPRILVSDSVIEHCAKFPHDPRDKAMVRDQTGRWVVNPFAMPFDGPDRVIKSFVQSNRFLPAKSTIDQQINSLEGNRQHRYAEKWRYLSNFIAGPVLDAAPKLRRFWQ